jgi:hypothetical protein
MVVQQPVAQTQGSDHASANALKTSISPACLLYRHHGENTNLFFHFIDAIESRERVAYVKAMGALPPRGIQAFFIASAAGSPDRVFLTGRRICDNPMWVFFAWLQGERAFVLIMGSPDGTGAQIRYYRTGYKSLIDEHEIL